MGCDFMKVLTIQEPYATFIMQGMKKIETRSWQTKYRGEIYIHAGKSKTYLRKIKDNNIMKLLENTKLNYGNIICKAELVDCIYMTNEFINKIKNKKDYEYTLGEYEIGRYAWVLKNIEKLENEIPAKGKLNIWTYNEDINKEK